MALAFYFDGWEDASAEKEIFQSAFREAVDVLTRLRPQWNYDDGQTMAKYILSASALPKGDGSGEMANALGLLAGIWSYLEAVSETGLRRALVPAVIQRTKRILQAVKGRPPITRYDYYRHTQSLWEHVERFRDAVVAEQYHDPKTEAQARLLTDLVRHALIRSPLHTALSGAKPAITGKPVLGVVAPVPAQAGRDPAMLAAMADLVAQTAPVRNVSDMAVAPGVERLFKFDEMRSETRNALAALPPGDYAAAIEGLELLPSSDITPLSIAAAAGLFCGAWDLYKEVMLNPGDPRLDSLRDALFEPSFKALDKILAHGLGRRAKDCFVDLALPVFRHSFGTLEIFRAGLKECLAETPVRSDPPQFRRLRVVELA